MIMKLVVKHTKKHIKSLEGQIEVVKTDNVTSSLGLY